MTCTCNHDGDSLAKGSHQDRGGEVQAIIDLSARVWRPVDKLLAELREKAKARATMQATIDAIQAEADRIAAAIELVVSTQQIWGVDPWMVANIIGSEMQTDSAR